MADKERVNIDFKAKFSNFVVNPMFTRCRCNIFYCGKNRNYSDITEQALQKLIDRKGYANVPVVGHLYQNKEGKLRLGGHDEKLVVDDINGFQIIDECVPFGCIPLDCDPKMESVIEASGEEKMYFSTDVVLWTHRYPIMEASYGQDIYFSQSMEIDVEDSHEDGQYTVIDDFSLSALCLLNLSDNPDENVEPCFESSRMSKKRKCSLENDSVLKQEFSLLLEELEKFNEEAKGMNKNNNNDNNTTKMKGVNYTMNKNVIDMLSTFKFTNQLGAETNKYEVLGMTDTNVYVLDKEDDYKVFSLAYAIVTEEEKENVVVDFESKVEGKIGFSEKNEEEVSFSIGNEIKTLSEGISKNTVDTEMKEFSEKITTEFNTKYDELKVEFEKALDNYEDVKGQLATYVEREEAQKFEQHKANVKTVLDEYYTKMKDYPEFLVYKAREKELYKKDIEEIKGELVLMLGKYTLASTSKTSNFSYNPESVAVNKTNGKSNDVNRERYGNLFDFIEK